MTTMMGSPILAEIDERLAIAVRYEEWRQRLPQRALPSRVRLALFRLILRVRG